MESIVLGKFCKFHDPSSNLSREIPPEAVRCGIFDCFLSYNFRSAVDNHDISGVVVNNAVIDICVKVCDCRSDGFRDIRGAAFVSNEHKEPYPNGAPNKMD